MQRYALIINHRFGPYGAIRQEKRARLAPGDPFGGPRGARNYRVVHLVIFIVLFVGTYISFIWEAFYLGNICIFYCPKSFIYVYYFFIVIYIVLFGKHLYL